MTRRSRIPTGGMVTCPTCHRPMQRHVWITGERQFTCRTNACARRNITLSLDQHMELTPQQVQQYARAQGRVWRAEVAT